MKKVDYRLWDEKMDNIGYLPNTACGEHSLGLPVVLDMGSINRPGCLSRLFRAAQDNFSHMPNIHLPKTPIQDRLYDDLRQAFRQALTGSSEDKKSYWDKCAEARKEGRLITDWAAPISKMPILPLLFQPIIPKGLRKNLASH